MRMYELKRIVFDVDPWWAAEFRGFFCADGCAGLWQEKRSYPRTRTNDVRCYYVYRPTLEFHLRADDKAFILDVKDKLGGSVSYLRARGPTNPAVRWQASGWPRVFSILEQVLLGGILLAKKQRDFEILYAACLARAKMPWSLGKKNTEILKNFHDQLIAVKRF